MKWTLQEVAAICNGRARGSAEVSAVEIDSRRVTTGSLFVAVRGERDDGHRYLDAAVAAGAAGVLVEQGRLESGPGVEVVDTIEALRRLAVARRAEIDIPVVAITGSSGKTTTKDLVAAVLGPGAHASPHSYNNEFGVPLTVLGAPDDAEALVVEVGSRGKGHIAHLASAIAPDVAVITNAGRAHLELFGSADAVVEAKWELVEALGEQGIAVLPADDDRLVGRGTVTTVTFGEESGADVDAVGVALDDQGRADLTLCHHGESVDIRMPVPGRHQPRNAACAVAAAVALGRPFAASAERLASASISPWRMESTQVSCPGGSFTLVNDAYNANPDSMESALATVAAMPGRHIAVLGKMHELGEFEAQAHREAGALAAALGFEVVVVGDDPGIAEGAGSDATSVADPEAAADRLRSLVAAGDVVLIKASRAAGLEAVAAGLEEVGR